MIFPVSMGALKMSFHFAHHAATIKFCGGSRADSVFVPITIRPLMSRMP